MKKNYSALLKLAMVCSFGFFSVSTMANQYPVTNTNNSGAGSLNDAISQANANPGLDTVTFNLPEDFSMTIALTSALPVITEGVFINGYSQPGSSAGTSVATRVIRINIDGTGLPGNTNIFDINSTDVTIAGLAIYKSTRCGVQINNGAVAYVWGNYIGTDSTGTTSGLGNALDGIACNTFNGTPNTGIRIEGNLISSNGEDGIFFWRTINSTIKGNVIGFDKNGGGSGFGNARNGILATQNSDGNIIGTEGDGISDNGEGNRIGNNAGRGIFLGTVSNNNVIAGNIVGLTATNTAAANGTNGIEVNPGSNNRIGTNSDGTSDILERNVIGFNTGDGIRIVGGDFFGSSNANGNIVAGNVIGTNAAGTLVAGNTAYGVHLMVNNNFSADGNFIGSNQDGVNDDVEGNIIANNAKGVVLDAPTGSSTLEGNVIAMNSIFDNTGLGIDLGDDGITANDNGDGDAGANARTNFPFITKSQIQAGNLVVTGVAPAGSIIEFYIADASGTEGKTYLFSGQEGGTFVNGITDDSTGTGSYSDVTYGIGTDERFGFTIPAASLPGTVTAGTIVIATATNTVGSPGSTSEFGLSFISTLPVRFTQFNGRVNNGVVSLEWSTSQEINNDRFEVERSSDGNQFSKIGTVAAKGGINNNYSLIDAKPSAVNFYRLKQVDKDGVFAYSKVLLLRTDLDRIGAKISPNPFRGAMNVSFQADRSETITIRLYNQTGQLVKQQTTRVNSGLNTINVGDLAVLPNGNYTIEVTGSKLKVKQQVVKQ